MYKTTLTQKRLLITFDGLANTCENETDQDDERWANICVLDIKKVDFFN